jgi:hypothetical protein
MIQTHFDRSIETKGIRLTPIRLRNSLYLLIPIELTKILDITKETEFCLNIKHDKNTVLIYNKIENSKSLQEDNTEKEPSQSSPIRDINPRIERE